MSFDSVWPIMNGRASGNNQSRTLGEELDNSLKEQTKAMSSEFSEFHGDTLVADKHVK